MSAGELPQQALCFEYALNSEVQQRLYVLSITWEFPKLGVPEVGVRIIRILLACAGDASPRRCLLEELCAPMTDKDTVDYRVSFDTCNTIHNIT